MPVQLSPLKRSFLALQELQSRLDAVERARREPIAIVGLACRVPGASGLAEFWDLLRQGVDAISEVPPERWGRDVDASGSGDGVSYGGFLRGMDTFDPQFFGIAPREAVGMDPQQRIFLEVCWEALEHAGIAPDRLKGRAAGVFAGVCTTDYATLQTRDGNYRNLDAHYASGIAHSIVTGRVSYLLGLNGPSMAIDTACSSSLVAVHLACQSLRSRETDLALAGGVNVIAVPDNAIAFARSGMMARDGRCKSFDAAADGFVRGEGSGVVVLKRLGDALADGDIIHALIRGSAVNQDGASTGLTAPSGAAQEAVIRSALDMAGIAPADVGYLETHGTGTVLGDPIEVQGLAAALTPGRTADRPLYMGSVKSNVGHLEAAAGITGLIKVALSLAHRAIPPHLHFRTPNPLIPWERLPLTVPTELTPWITAGGTRIGGISSFGFGGTNAHVVLEQAPEPTEPSQGEFARPRHLLTLSAPTTSGLRALAGKYAEALEGNEASPADIAFTANTGRAQLRHRAAIQAAPGQGFLEALRAVATGRDDIRVIEGEATSPDGPRIAFLFTGQGAQYVGMGRQLYETEPVFRSVLNQCNELLEGQLSPGLLRVLYPSAGDPSPLEQTAYTQPALFAIEYAMARVWHEWGIRPAAVMGHSLGEYVAATVAGAMRLEDALALVTARGRLIQDLPPVGGMAAVLTSADRVRDVLHRHGDLVTIAAINSPENTVISGPREALADVTAVFRAQGVDAKPLLISHAFHSAALDPILDEFHAIASRFSYAPPQLPLFSNLTGTRASNTAPLTADYWTSHLRQPVLFSAAFEALLGAGTSTFLELGPHTTLLGLARQCRPELEGTWLPSLRRDQDDWEILLGSVARLYALGAPIDWSAFDRPYARRRVVLPTYPFERRRYWVTPQVPSTARPGSSEGHPMLATTIASPFAPDRIFEADLSVAAFPWLADHRVLDSVVMPAAAHLEAAWAAARKVHGDAVVALEDIDIREALVLPEGASRVMHVGISPRHGDLGQFRIASAPAPQRESADAWRVHAAGTVSFAASSVPDDGVDLAAIRARCALSIPPSQYYDDIARRSVVLGPSFRGLVGIGQGTGEAIGEVRAPLAGEAHRHFVHPTILDAMLQVVAAAVFGPEDAGSREVYLPIGVERFRVLKPAEGTLWSHVSVRSRAAGQSPQADVQLYDDAGRLVVELAGLQLRRVQPEAWSGRQRPPIEASLYDVAWRAEPGAASPASPVEEWVLPPAGEVAREVAPKASGLAQQHGLHEYEQLLPQLDALCRDHVVNALLQLGWSASVGTRVDASGLAGQLGVAAPHHRLLARLLAILAEDGILDQVPGGWVVQRPLLRSETDARSAALRSAFPAGAAELGLLARTGPHLAECLRGTIDPLSLLFAGGSLDAADELYRRSPPALVTNGLAREAVRRLVASSPASRRIRILEIGAGTGGTTSFVLPELPSDRTEYLYTDLSPLFLARAEERLGNEFPFVEYRTLDVEADPATQGMESGRFDLVIAANVLHATRDMAETLGHVSWLVRPGGSVLLLEGTRPQRWIDLTFGLTDGWWRFTDRDLRPDYPLMDAGKWRDELQKVGLEEAAAVPGDGAPGALADNIILVARKVAVPSRPSAWVVFADARGAAATAADDLRRAGRKVVLVTPGSGFARTANGYQLDPAVPQDYHALMERLSKDEEVVEGLIHFWSLDTAWRDDFSVADLERAQVDGTRSVLSLVQAAATSAGATSCRLVLVTQGAQSVKAGEPVVPVHAPLWGLAGGIRLEHPDFECVTVDLDPAAASPASGLVARLLAGASEPQLASRGGEWFTARLSRHMLEAGTGAPAGAAPVLAEELVTGTPGILDGLAFRPASRRTLAKDEVEIRVRATGLNFRDVLIAMGLYPGASEAGPLGGECAGEVVAVGAEVTRFKVGDAVMALAPGAFGTTAIAHQELVLPRPASLSWAEAVTIPAAFMTAWYSLHDLARLGPGERVLIHAAAGGVGLAAVRLAQRAGAVVFATAGSPEKRAYLHSLGVEHVLDSRSAAFADAIMKLTDGAGVDVVLNSLADELIPASLRIVGKGGRFIELGKRGIWSGSQVRETHPDISYFIVDLAASGADEPHRVGAVLRAVHQALETGEIHALPQRIFARRDVATAFRYMAQARHIGKVVVVHDATDTAPLVRPDGAYLITGGLGGLGLVTARWLVEQGAGQVVLMSRGAPGDEALSTLASLNGSASKVRVVRGDIGNAADAERVLTGIRGGAYPLRGVIHAAGTLHDGVLAGQDWDAFRAPLRAKMDGTWNLHQLTRQDPLDFLVLFSSISAVLGSPGQGNHSAANAFIDSFARFRRGMGLPAQSINWGAWEDVGAAAQHGVVDRIAGQGMGSFSPADGIRALEMILRSDTAQVAVMPVDWGSFGRQFAAGRLRSNLLVELMPVEQPRAAVAEAQAPPPVAEVPVREAPVAVREGLLRERLRVLAAKVLALDTPASLDPDRPLQELGLDSLMAVELRNLMKAALGLDKAPSATVVFDYPTVNALAEYVKGVFGWTVAAPQPVVREVPEGNAIAGVEQLSEEEADRMLAARLARGR
jgi:acyl transferase domain-containing protein/acyl carrier protein